MALMSSQLHFKFFHDLGTQSSPWLLQFMWKHWPASTTTTWPIAPTPSRLCLVHLITAYNSSYATHVQSQLVPLNYLPRQGSHDLAMAIKQLSNIAFKDNISHVYCSFHINSQTLTKIFQEPQDAQGTWYIIWLRQSAPKLIHNNVEYEII